MGYSYASDGNRCPSDVGYNWKYSNNGWQWLDAGNALTIKCISESGIKTSKGLFSIFVCYL